MTTRVNLDGTIVGPEQATISVFDRGFLYGDSVYEAVRTYGGRPFELKRHLVRLDDSASRIGLTLPWPLDQIAREIGRTVEAAANPDSYIRVVVTRGEGPIQLDPATAQAPRTIVIVQELEPLPAKTYREGVKIQLVNVRHNLKDAIDPQAKTGNYLNSVLAVREAKTRFAHEAVLLDKDGLVTEGASSNLFVVRGVRLVTPPLEAGILEGVTRGVVLELARSLGIPTEERVLRPEELLSADEAMITSTVRQIVPVTRVGVRDDERRLGGGQVGPTVRRLMEAFEDNAWRSVGLEPPG